MGTRLEPSLEFTADVLIIGGGPAGAWAAHAAAKRGATVALVDKGYCGTSGAAAASGVGMWFVRPNDREREQAVNSRYVLGRFLGDQAWIARLLDETHVGMLQLIRWGYPFPRDVSGELYLRSLQGPEYMRLMRRIVRRSGVKILDQSPAVELLANSDGSVAGAIGIRRQTGEHWRVRSRTVVLATGGCAFRSHGLGCDVLTGDGHLMAAEAGVELAPLWWTSRKGLLSSEFRQCSREKIVQIHSRKTLSAA